MLATITFSRGDLQALLKNQEKINFTRILRF